MVSKCVEFSKGFIEDKYFNETLFESENFKVIPSLGSLVDGWLLVIPKQHYISYGALSRTQLYAEFEDLVTTVGTFVKEEYGDFIVFEHGPIQDKTPVGCGVDYAHMHIVPLNVNLIELAQRHLNNNFFWEPVQELKDLNNYYSTNKPYLFFRSAGGEQFVSTSDNIPSQFFRKLIAIEVGLKDYYDWKVNSFLENIDKTINRLSKYSPSEVVEEILSYE